MLTMLAASAIVVITAIVCTPTAHGDSGEYFLTAEALANHGSPDIRPADVASLTRLGSTHPIRAAFGGLMRDLRRAPDGRFYTVHFWAYPLVTLPAKFVLRLIRANEFAAPQLTNAVLLLAISWVALLGPWSSEGDGWSALLGMVGPPMWFTLWPHPEVLSYCTAFAGLIFASHQPTLAVALAAVGAMQNPPLALLAAAIAMYGVVRAKTSQRLHSALVLALAFGLALLPTLFYLWTFGRPSLIAPEGAMLSQASVEKALGLFFDLNLGLLPYLPVTLALAGSALVAALRRGRRSALVGLGLTAIASAMAFLCSTTGNWNHGTAGPSRYAVWLIPLVTVSAGAMSSRRLVVAALLTQAMITAARIGVWEEEDYTRHSYLARFVLTHWPALYNPSREVFTGRTPQLGEGGPFLFASDGHCRKALAQKRHHDLLHARCGAEPPSFARWRETIAEQGRGRDRWTYVDY
jgi:hypothetical protein